MFDHPVEPPSPSPLLRPEREGCAHRTTAPFMAVAIDPRARLTNWRHISTERRSAHFRKAGQAVFGMAHAPLRRRAGCAAERPPDRPRRGAGGRHQHDSRLQARPVFRPRRTRQIVKLPANRTSHRDVVFSWIRLVTSPARSHRRSQKRYRCIGIRPHRPERD